MNKSTYLSLGLFLAVALWMLSGIFSNDPESQAALATDNSNTTANPHQMTVGIMAIASESIVREVVLQGELEPLRTVELRAQTTSRVVNLPINKGDRVTEGTLLVQLAAEDREAQFKSAQAELLSQQLEVAGARKLQKKGLQSTTQLKSREAALALAEAALEKARLELEYTTIKTPFNGVLEDRYVELGSHLEKGDQVALIVDESVLKAVGYVSQQSAGELHLGQMIKVQLLDGREASGALTYISSIGDAQTHSFRIEAEINNIEGLLTAGVSVEMRIATGQETAHFVSPAVLSLNSHGEIGIKSVNGENIVSFYPIELVRTEDDGVWVSGLPDNIQIITQGQGFVNAGEPVKAVPAS